MKNRHILFAAAAVLTLFGCNKEIDYGPAKVEVDKAEVEVTKEAGSVTVSLNATIDWAAKVDSDDADWLDISPATGGPSLEAQTLTIKYTENTGINREATILVQGDVLHKTYINVKQAGPKGDEDTCTVAEFIQKADKQNPYVLTGTVSGFNATYCSFDLTDESGKIYVYSIAESSKTLAATIKNGGTVKIKGYYDYYESKAQHEVVNAEILSYEAPEDIDPSKIETITVKEFLDKADATKPYRLVGTVTGYNATYNSFNLKDSTGSIYIFSIDEASKAAFADNLANGKKVTLYGTYYWYENANDSSKSKAEINPATIEKVEDGGGDSGDYENAPAKTVDEFISAADGETYYKLTGTVSGFNAQYCSFDLTDKTGKIYVYSVINKSEWSDKISNGGTVTLAGKYLYYEKSGKDEVVDTYILSFEEGQGGGGEGDDDYENAPAKTVDEFVSAADGDTYYKLTGTVSGFNAKYCSFDLTDKTGKIYVYSVINKDEWSSKVQDGGTVTLAGKYLYYEKGSKHEVVDAYILSFDDGQGGGEGDDDGATAEGIVVAVSSQAFLVQTASGYTYVFAKADPGVKVGDEVKVSGTPGTYAGLPQINEPTTTVVSSGNSVKYPEPKTLDGASMDSYDTGFGYVKVTGNLTKSGNYYNLDVKGSSRTGSLSYPVNVPDALVGKTVDVTGFFVGITGNIYFNILAVDLKESANQDVETLSHPLTSGIKWTLGTNGYDGTTKTAMSATVNGTKVTDFIKLGTSSAGGDATLAIPAGVKKIGFYAAGWKTTQSEESSGTTMSSPVTIKVGGKSLDVKRNKGCTSNPPFTITFSDETDYYEVEVTEDSSVKIEAPSRIVIIGINAI